MYSDQMHWSASWWSHSILPYETGCRHTHARARANTQSELGSIAEYHGSDIINGAHCVLYGSTLTSRWLHWPAAAAALLTARERWKKLAAHTHKDYELTRTHTATLCVAILKMCIHNVLHLHTHTHTHWLQLSVSIKCPIYLLVVSVWMYTVSKCMSMILSNMKRRRARCLIVRGLRMSLCLCEQGSFMEQDCGSFLNNCACPLRRSLLRPRTATLNMSGMVLPAVFSLEVGHMFSPFAFLGLSPGSAAPFHCLLSHHFCCLV